MSFDWTTFLLEVLNFFILLWILQRFLYRPVLGVIQARQQRIDAELQDAAARQAEARSARQACEEQLAEWEQAKARARTQLEQDVATERERLLQGVNQEVAEARARHQAQALHDRREWQRMTEQRAVELGGRFVSKLLERVASPALEERLVAVLVADLEQLSEAERDPIRTALWENGLEVVSAFPLTGPQRQAVTDALAGLAGRAVSPVFRVDPVVISGLRIHAGSRVLGANLYDELRYFREVEDGV